MVQPEREYMPSPEGVRPGRLIEVSPSVFPKLYNPSFVKRVEEAGKKSIFVTKLYESSFPRYPIPDILTSNSPHVIAARMIKGGHNLLDWWKEAPSVYPDKMIVELPKSMLSPIARGGLLEKIDEGTKNWIMQQLTGEPDYNSGKKLAVQKILYGRNKYATYSLVSGHVKDDETGNIIETKKNFIEYFEKNGVTILPGSFPRDMGSSVSGLVTKKFIAALREENLELDYDSYFQSVSSHLLHQSLEEVVFSRSHPRELRMIFPVSTSIGLKTGSNLPEENGYVFEYLPYAARSCVIYLASLPKVIPEGKVIYIDEVDEQVRKLKQLYKDSLIQELNGERPAELKKNNPEKYDRINEINKDVNVSFSRLDLLVGEYSKRGNSLNKTVGTPSVGSLPSTAYFREKIHSAGAPLKHLSKSRPGVI